MKLTNLTFSAAPEGLHVMGVLANVALATHDGKQVQSMEFNLTDENDLANLTGWLRPIWNQGRAKQKGIDRE